MTLVVIGVGYVIGTMGEYYERGQGKKSNCPKGSTAYKNDGLSF